MTMCVERSSNVPYTSLHREGRGHANAMTNASRLKLLLIHLERSSSSISAAKALPMLLSVGKHSMRLAWLC